MSTWNRESHLAAFVTLYSRSRFLESNVLYLDRLFSQYRIGFIELRLSLEVPEDT